MSASPEAISKVVATCREAGPEFTMQELISQLTSQDTALLGVFPDVWEHLIASHQVVLTRTGERNYYCLAATECLSEQAESQEG